MFTNPDFQQRVNAPGLFSTHNGITVTTARPGYASGVLEITDFSLNPHGTVHGGCLYTLADTVAGTAAAADAEHGCVTVSGTLEFLRPATGKHIFCAASPKKLGRTLRVMQVELTNEPGKVVATGTFTFMLVGQDGQ